MQKQLFSRGLVTALALVTASAASAQLNTATGIVTGNNVSYANGPVAVTLNGITFTNQGLVGVGRIDANSIDAWGESFGSVSGLQIRNWSKTGPNEYSGSLYILPDRGYNNTTFSNYAARIQKVDFTFRPEKGSAFNGKTVAQDQFTFAYDGHGSIKFTCKSLDDPDHFVVTTGLVPDSSTLLATKGVPFVTKSDGTPTLPVSGGVTINKVSLDAEALVLKADGSGYIGDEYAANIYHFNSAKQIDGVIAPPLAIQPRLANNTVVYSSEVSNAKGRRGNQGMEGVALSPDGTRLFGLMQSATLQDSGSGSQGRLNTRLMVYDVQTNAVPSAPVVEYVLRLPVLSEKGSGAPDKTAAQSEIVALDHTHLLVLSRDSNGKGTATAFAPVFKSVLLVDLANATDISKLNGGAYDAVGGDITPSGTTLAAGITPLAWAEAVNLLSASQLEKFGLNMNSGATANVNSLSEKWEGVALVPANEGNGNTYYLFVANDNDFISTATKMRSLDGSTITTVDAVAAAGIPVKNDTMFLVFRVTIDGLAKHRGQ